MKVRTHSLFLQSRALSLTLKPYRLWPITRGSYNRVAYNELKTHIGHRYCLLACRPLVELVESSWGGDDD